MRTLLAVLLVTASWGCIGTDLVDRPLAPSGSQAIIEENTIIITEGGAHLLNYHLEAPDGTILEANWSWSTRNGSIATVDSEGLVTGNGNGQTWIDGIANSQFRDSVLVTVINDPQSVASVTILGDSSNMAAGETRQLQAVLRNFNGDEISGEINWTSSDGNILTVNVSGLVTANQDGKASVTASADGKSSLPFPITVGETVNSRTGTFSGLNGYNASGTAILEQSGNSANLFLDEDFQTQNGPGLYVYLTKNTQNVAGGVDLGKLQSTSGSQSYNIPQSINPGDFTYVMIYCQPFGVPFGAAELK